MEPPVEIAVDDVPRRRVWDFLLTQLYKPRDRCTQTPLPHRRVEDALQVHDLLRHELLVEDLTTPGLSLPL